MDLPSLPFQWNTCLLFSLLSYPTLFLLNNLLRFIHYVWWTPRRLQLLMERQGIRGPPPQFLLGNLRQIKKLDNSIRFDEGSIMRHGMLECINPHYSVWAKAYGKRHLVWWGTQPSIVLTDMDSIKEIFSQRHALTWGKPYLPSQKFLEPITGMGLLAANGEDWAHQKRVVGPAFHSNTLKVFKKKMVNCIDEMLGEIHRIVNNGGGMTEVEVGMYITRTSAEIIAHTQFGSSYEEGKVIFKNLDTLRSCVFQNFSLYFLPGNRFLPISALRHIRKLTKEIEVSIGHIIKERKDSKETGRIKSYGNDLLGLMLAESEAASADGEKQRPQLTVKQLVDECKTFFFAGHEATTRLVTWSLLLLAAHPSWQERAREEIRSVTHSDTSSISESINKMKNLEMIIYETLRLYPVVPGVFRQASCDMQLANVFIPKGVSAFIPIVAIHFDKDLWGEDVNEFNPDRFAEGMGKASKHPLAFMPFSHGPRNCIGQTFALTEVKILLAMFLTRFKLYPSPNYRHAPQHLLTLAPLYGAPVIIEAMDTTR